MLTNTDSVFPPGFFISKEQPWLILCQFFRQAYNAAVLARHCPARAQHPGLTESRCSSSSLALSKSQQKKRNYIDNFSRQQNLISVPVSLMCCINIFSVVRAYIN